MRAGPSQEEVRRQNLGALLRLVHHRGATSRAELTAQLGLNRSTIGALTAELAAAGLVTEGAPSGTRRAGRPSLVVSPRAEGVYAYALAVEVDRLSAARVGLGGVMLDRREADRDPGLPPETAVKSLAGFVTEMHPASTGEVGCIGVGLAAAGRLRADDGTIGLAPPVETLAGPLRTALAPVLPPDRPVAVGPAADLAALAEHARGVAVGYDNVIYLAGDVGVAAGIIAGGRRVSGYQGAAGEVGHMVVSPAGRPCGCGSRGCWETEVGEAALLAAAGRNDRRGRAAVRAVIDAAGRGDSQAKTALRQVSGWLGFGVGNLINIFNPELVVFGESLRDVYLAAAAPIRSRLHEVGLADSLSHVRLRTPALGDDAALLGAAELAFDRLLADPLDAAA